MANNDVNPDSPKGKTNRFAWTGLFAYTKPDEKTDRGKTLWDWLSLLLVPVLLAAGSYFLNAQTTLRQDSQQAAQSDSDATAVAARSTDSANSAATQFYSAATDVAARSTDSAISALDSARVAALQNYLDRMDDLLLQENLFQTPVPGEAPREVAVIARTLTLTAFSQLDGPRNGIVLRFLSNAGLIQGDNPIIQFLFTDLDGVNLRGADATLLDIHGVELGGANLSDLFLYKSKASGAILSLADLRGAILTFADLRGADLTMAKLSGADLRGADLSGAGLSGADLSGADLTEATLTGATIDKHTTLDTDTTLPDGNKWTAAADLTQFGVMICVDGSPCPTPTPPPH